ncbi:MucB/RseB C-terminal domain-containing protein [Pseudomonas sp. 32.2.56]|uniref:MucB/RseB C-terminal domain-containing protein n=1 Tax=Pseudomonas sp. 32.2.56 TaxID=2969303 RepID=UPI00214F94FF|nr:MucB/RseB C-terminal domain-containing protein [Pseudomonas sp. 32.2.56]MCR4510475.1 MucB/RseB C-terminal domain-containing protein [Pseudomonas sp. 32.2.56]
MRFIPLSVLLLGSCLVLPAVADDGAALLQRLVDAERTQSFNGTFVYERNGSFSTHSIWHQFGGDGTLRERLLQLDGSAQEVLRVDGRVQCASGALADQLIDSQLWPTRELDAAQLSEWYELRVLGDSRVAGRATRVLALVPRDQHRYGIELHLDQQTGLPLKSLLVNDKGQLLERFQFTHLQAEVPADANLQPGAGCRPVRLSPAQAELAEAWRSDWLPPGFSLNSVTQRRSPASDEPVACQVYGDGLARFSVFMEPLRGAAVEDVRTQLGPTVAVSRRLKTADGDVMVTVVGEIPLGTAERVALSMRSTAEVAP